MENEFYEDEFEQLLKERADQFSMYPSKRVWHSIYNNLHPGRKWPSVVMSLLLIGSLILIGYLNTGENSITKQINSNASTQSSFEKNNETSITQTTNPGSAFNTHAPVIQKPEAGYNNAFEDVITNTPDQYSYTVVRSNRPVYAAASETTEQKPLVTAAPSNSNGHDIIEAVDNYIKSNQIFADVAANNRKAGGAPGKSSVKNNSGNTSAGTSTEEIASAQEEINAIAKKQSIELLPNNGSKKNELAANNAGKDKNGKLKTGLTDEEKAWIENYALQNKTAAKKWKGKLGYQFYVTPAVNYRKLTTNSKGSATAFANADINNSISQKPGFGFETGLGVNYLVAKRIQLKAGVQFNYTNYNIAADETNHPISTTILLNDPATGYSYSAARMSTTSNSFNATPLQPVTLHNRTYQVSLPVGFAYRISSQNNVDWFAGATIQPSYVFNGDAHIISSDLKSYVSDRSSISPWNLNLGFETYMNFKLGSYNLQVGPQVRYQVNSTYKKDIALIEKPYAVGLKFGLTKGF